MTRLKFVFLISLIIPLNCSAEQSHFRKKEQGENYLFNYLWYDQQRDLQSIVFPLSKPALFDRFRQFRAYKAAMAERYVQRGIKKQLEKQPLPGVRVHFKRQDNSYQIDIKGRDQQQIQAAYNKIQALEQQYMLQYLENNYYHRFITHDQVAGIKPDHVRIANDSVADLKPMKQLIIEKVPIKNIRRVVNFVLAYVQSIPYSPLESRATSSGAGFSTPLKLLWENKGDCDSKLTLTAALLRSLMPRIKMVLVFIDQHAFIGIEVYPEAGEITLTENNVTYVLAEQTGPALLTLGTIGASSERAINNGHYIAEEFH